MLQNRAASGVTVVSVRRIDQCSSHQRKHQREVSVKVTRVKRNSSNKSKMVNLGHRDGNTDVDQEWKPSDHISLEEPINTLVPFNQYESRIMPSVFVRPSPIKMSELSVTRQMNNSYPRLMTGSSWNKSCSLFENNDTSFNFIRTNSIKEYQKQPSKGRSRLYQNPTFELRSKKSTGQLEINNKIKKKKRRRICKICPAYSNCCCFASAIGLLLLLAGLAALLIFLLANKNITTTAATTTTAAATSITTTPAPPCIPTSVGSSSTIYSTTSGSATNYTCHAYTWTSSTTGLVTLNFQLRHDPSYWLLDDVSVYGGAVQMLINGGFETGSLTPWVRAIPNGNCAGTAGQVSTLTPHSGTYCVIDGSSGCADEISQQFMATAGQVYVVSFWLKSGLTGSVISALVTLS